MNRKVRLLLVEDSEADQGVWKRLIEQHAAKVEGTETPSFELTIAATLETAQLTISAQDFDAAIVDLRLKNSTAEGMDSSGNAVIAQLLATEMAAVAAFTGEPSAVEIPDHAKAVVKIFTKGADEGEGPHAVLAWLIAQIPMFIAIRKAEEIIKGEMAKFFVKSLWPRWNNWLENDEQSEKSFLSAAVARHLASHVHAALLDKYQHKAHPEEWFFVPPIHSGIRTGDIIRSPDPYGLEIVITPRCDLATGKRKTIQLASCEDVSKDWEILLKKRLAIQSSMQEHLAKGTPVPNKLEVDLVAADNKCRAFTQHRNTSSLHFLPQMKLTDGTSVGPLMIHFDQIRSEPVASLEAKVVAGRIASVSTEFIPSIVERLGTFFSRIGTPDYSDAAT